jgi:NADPH:quinone reductase-like Zn-dependent oxidoreductase
MKACQAKDYGDIDSMLTVEEEVPYPSLASLPTKSMRQNTMIIRTYAVATACGDTRTLSGLTREIQGPPSFPYIPCGDCAGVVVEIPSLLPPNKKEFPFKVGDKVAARFLAFPRDALAEYAMLRQEVCERIPEGMSFVEAAALAGACPATLLAERIHPGERVLILGARGGVGSLTSQIMKSHRGVSFLAGAASTVLPPSRGGSDDPYDTIIDYTQQDPFTVPEFQDKPFDVVVDLAGAGAWLTIVKNAQRQQPQFRSIVKPASQGGRYLTLTPDQAIFELHSISTALKLFLCIPLWRAIKSRLWCRTTLPKYTYAMCLDEERSHLTRTLAMAAPVLEPTMIHAVVDPRGPHPFTTEGVRAAFRIQESRHAYGKVVIEVTKKE